MADYPESVEQEYPYFDELPLSDQLRITALEVEGLVPERLVEVLEEAAAWLELHPQPAIEYGGRGPNGPLC